jgi:hypothetical protein
LLLAASSAHIQLTNSVVTQAITIFFVFIIISLSNMVQFKSEHHDSLQVNVIWLNQRHDLSRPAAASLAASLHHGIICLTATALLRV